MKPGITEILNSKFKQMITLKMADQERYDCNVVFTMILCGLNFCVWTVTKLIFST